MDESKVKRREEEKKSSTRFQELRNIVGLQYPVATSISSLRIAVFYSMTLSERA